MKFVQTRTALFTFANWDKSDLPNHLFSGFLVPSLIAMFLFVCYFKGFAKKFKRIEKAIILCYVKYKSRKNAERDEGRGCQSEKKGWAGGGWALCRERGGLMRGRSLTSRGVIAGTRSLHAS